MRIAAVQFACTLGDVPENVNKIRDFCARAKREGVDLIVFPEAADTGLLNAGHPPARDAVDGRRGAGASSHGERVRAHDRERSNRNARAMSFRIRRFSSIPAARSRRAIGRPISLCSRRMTKAAAIRRATGL